jgi:hypothetical protein
MMPFSASSGYIYITSKWANACFFTQVFYAVLVHLFFFLKKQLLKVTDMLCVESSVQHELAAAKLPNLSHLEFNKKVMKDWQEIYKTK